MNYLTIPKLAQAVGLSDNTVRRYIRHYPQFFKKEMVDGFVQYEVKSSLKIIRRLNEISEAGKRRAAVLREIGNEFQVVGKPEIEIKDRIEFGPKTLGVLSEIRDVLKVIAEKLR